MLRTLVCYWQKPKETKTERKFSPFSYIIIRFQPWSNNYHIFKWRASLSCKNNFVVFVIDDQSLWAGHGSRSITVLVVDDNWKIVSRNDLFDQDVCTVFLEAVILPIKCQIMRISPANANTCKHDSKLSLTAPVLKCEIINRGFNIELTSAFVMETTPIFIVNLNCWFAIFTHRDRNRFAQWHCNYCSICTSVFGAVFGIPCFTMLERTRSYVQLKSNKKSLPLSFLTHTIVK